MYNVFGYLVRMDYTIENIDGLNIGACSVMLSYQSD